VQKAESDWVNLLGAIIAGGKARRFGSDKAFALLDGERLIDMIGNSLRAQVAATVICGRTLPGWLSLDDRPAADLGPLGGLCAALHHAKQNSYDAVLSVATDVIPLPPQLAEWLTEKTSAGTRAAFVKGQHLLGIWPASLNEQLDQHLAAHPADRSLRGWIAACDARAVTLQTDFANINTPDDLHHWQSRPR
jgi:molybdopterin-guanine dinucleotide biosynthesis protein A